MSVRRTLSAIFVFCIALSLAGCSQTATPTAQSVAQTTSASSQAGTSVDVVSAKAFVVPYKHADLAFRTVGRIQEILVSEGQTVTAGQDLARLDASDVEQAVLGADASLKSAQAQLAKAKAGARPAEITSSEAGVKAAEANAAITAGNLESAKADLEVAQAGVTVAEGNLAAAQASWSSATANLNKLLAGPTDSEIKIAEKQVERAKNELYTVQKQRDAAFNINEGQIGAAEVAVEIAQLQLDQLKEGARSEDIATARAQVAQAQAGIQTAQGQLEQARARVAQVKASVQIAEAQVAQAQAQVAQAQAQLDLIKAGSRAEDIAVAEAAVAQAEASLKEAEQARSDTVLRAPFDGTIGAILIDQGEISSLQSVAIRIGDLTRLQVETEDLSEVDVSLMQVGQEAQVTIDALGSKPFRATVAEIAPVASDYRGDKVYTVVFDLDAGLEAGLRWGMSAFVETKVR